MFDRVLEELLAVLLDPAAHVRFVTSRSGSNVADDLADPSPMSSGRDLELVLERLREVADRREDRRVQPRLRAARSSRARASSSSAARPLGDVLAETAARRVASRADRAPPLSSGGDGHLDQPGRVRVGVLVQKVGVVEQRLLVAARLAQQPHLPRRLRALR